MNKINFIKNVVILIVFAFIFNVAYSFYVNASDSYIINQGYFTRTYRAVRDGTTVIYTNDHQFEAIPTSVDDVSSLVSYLKGKYNSGREQDQIAAAFVVDTFMDDGDRDLTINSDRWSDFQDKFQSFQDKGLITWDRTKLYSITNDFNNVNSLYSPSINDDLFYTDTTGRMVSAIYIKNLDGSFAYAIKYDCGNPIGLPNAIEPPTEPVITPPAVDACRPIIITVPSQTNYKGSAVNVKVWITSDSTGSTVFSKTYRGYTADHDEDFTAKCTTGDKYTAHFDIARYIYKCTPKEGGGCTPKRTDPAPTTEQFGPCYDYLLKSSIQSISTYSVEANTSVIVTPIVANSSWTQSQTSWFDFYNKYQTSTKSKPTEWQVSRIKIDPGVIIPASSAASSDLNPCSYLKTKSISKCASEKSGSGVLFQKNSTNLDTSGKNPFPTINALIGDEEAGTKVCFVLSVRSATSEGPDGSGNESSTISSTWYHSAIAKNNCVIIVKKPKVQVLGGDVKTGRSFDGINATAKRLSILTLNSIKSVDGKLQMFGSWAEYGLFAAGKIQGMGSASAFSQGVAASSGGVPQSNYSKLTFSNTNAPKDNPILCSSPSVNGCYPYRKVTIPDISASFPAASTSRSVSGVVKLDNVVTFPVSGLYSANSDITINGGNIPKGKWIVINASGRTVTISNNIFYDSAKVNNISDLPQLVIIAKTIKINANVTNVDSWLIAKDKDGSLSTCNGFEDERLTVADCDRQLTINGPVMASSLFLRRTYGSGTSSASGDPAEVFNLRADAYLWAYARATGSGRVWTVYTTNVPTRL